MTERNGNDPTYITTSNQFDAQFKYKMDHKRRGIAIIFSHKTFDKVLSAGERTGAGGDCKRMHSCFQMLGFKVRSYKDLSVAEIFTKLLQVCSKDHSNNDCLAIIVMTHGDSGGILYAKDGKYKQEQLWMPFTASMCQTLKGKPKLFFIQACRGSKLDQGIKLVQVNGNKVFQPMTGPFVTASVDKDPSDSEFSKSPNSSLLDLERDFLVVHATVSGHYAWRGGDRKAWFINKLYHELISKPIDHLLIILIRVSAGVAFDCASHTLSSTKEEIRAMNDMKQVPCVTSSLSKLLFLHENKN